MWKILKFYPDFWKELPYPDFYLDKIRIKEHGRHLKESPSFTTSLESGSFLVKEKPFDESKTKKIVNTMIRYDNILELGSNWVVNVKHDKSLLKNKIYPYCVNSDFRLRPIVIILCRNHELSWTMSWVGCFLPDQELPDKWKLRKWE